MAAMITTVAVVASVFPVTGIDRALGEDGGAALLEGLGGLGVSVVRYRIRTRTMKGRGPAAIPPSVGTSGGPP